MRKALYIISFLLCCLAMHGLSCGETAHETCVRQDTVANRSTQQFECLRRCNLDPEMPSPIVVPTAERSVVQVRCGSLRTLHALLCKTKSSSGSCRNGAEHHIYRLSSGSRATDYFLHALCRLRI
ncbi:MAG: hypothetical protein KH375_04280 [Alistipes sp.]|nr:hypothetical protein [Alistipes sp.]